MKKIIAMILALTMVVSMAACGSKKEEAPETEDGVVEEKPETETPAEPEEKPEEETAPETEEKPEEEAAPETEAPETEGEAAPEDTVPDEIPGVEAPELSEAAAALMEKLNALTNGITEDLVTMDMEVAPDMYEYYMGIPYVEGATAVVSEPMIGAIAHTIVLMEVPEGTDVAAVAASVEENMDPRRWICVEAEEAWVKTSGQYVLMVMSDAEMAGIVEANFATVFGA